MNRGVVLAVSVSVVSLFLSSVGVYLALTQPKESEPYYFSVTVNSADTFRIYVQVESKVVVADEDVGAQLYGFSAYVGQLVELKVVCENVSAVFTVDFAYASPYSLIQTVSHESPITMQYIVPS